MMKTAHPPLYLKQCNGVPGFPIFLGEFKFQDDFRFVIEYNMTMYRFPEGELWFRVWILINNYNDKISNKYSVDSFIEYNYEYLCQMAQELFYEKLDTGLVKQTPIMLQARIKLGCCLFKSTIYRFIML